jgi:hypothetical protein
MNRNVWRMQGDSFRIWKKLVAIYVFQDSRASGGFVATGQASLKRMDLT